MHNTEGQMNIWKDVLEKMVSASKLTRAVTVPKDNDQEFKYQVFEVMIAEALNLCDHNASWQVTRGGKDKGVDLIGTEKRSYSEPLTNNVLYKKILGQIKRHARGYSFDLFCGDLQKVQKYCSNTEFYKNNALLYFMFVLSTDNKNSVINLRKRIDSEEKSKQDSVFISNRPGPIKICDASELMRIWKINFPYFEHILSDALTKDEMQFLFEFLDEIDNSWFSVSISQESEHFAGEAFEQIVSINTDMENTNVDMLVKWHPAEDNCFQLLNPLQAINPYKGGFSRRVHKTAQFKLIFRGSSAGEHDCGMLEFSSTEKRLIVMHPIGKIKIKPGFYSDYFNKPNYHILHNLETELTREESELTAYAVTGCGGIGKSSLIYEVMIHAAGRGYNCIDIAQTKDFLNRRLLLRSLLKKLVYLNEFEICYNQNIIDEVKEYLRTRYNEEWNTDLFAFFTHDDVDINIGTLAECLANILIEAANEQPLFIWLSDMHWSASETLSIIRQTILILKSNKAVLCNKVLFIFEGRKWEALESCSTQSIPYDWYQFLENDYLIKLNLSVWSEQDSRDLLKKMIPHRENETEVYTRLYDVLLRYSKGVPMHLLEYIRFLLDKGKLLLDTNQRLVILNNDFSFSFPEEIQQTIHNRIICFTEKYPELIEIMTVFAIFNDVMPHKLFLLFWQRLNDLYPNLQTIVKECDFIKISKEGFSFLHEYYLTAFRDNNLSNQNIISLCLDFFNGEFTDHEALKIIKLKQARIGIQDDEIIPDVLELLDRVKDPMLRYELYSMLLQFHNISESKIPKYKIHFELCEIMVKVGSWEKASQHLAHMFNDVNDSSMECKYYHTLAYQELANIQCDKMEFDLSIQTTLDGIELAKVCLKNKDMDDVLRNSFLRSHEKLLARIAVCYWFVGDHDKCNVYQKQSLDSARSRCDTYAEAHVQYEIATFKFHEDLDYGINLMQDIINNIANIPDLEKYERGLIEVQQLIGKLMKAARYSDNELLQDIGLETRRLHELYNTGNNCVYEEFLCYTIRAIYFMITGNREQALFWFFESLKCASIGNTPNLEWKANFNLSQYYYTEGDEAVSRVYARQTLAILEKAYTQNPKNRACFCTMVKSVIKKLEKILNIPIVNFQNTEPIMFSLLSVQVGENEFVIMN
jgi:hypothetical protein